MKNQKKKSKKLSPRSKSPNVAAKVGRTAPTLLSETSPVSKTSASDINLAPKVHPLVAILPDHLKDPANYEKIQAAVLATIMTTCSHGDLLEWSKCKKCTNKMLERRLLLRKLGFTNPAQYMAWRKIHAKIKEKMPLMKWK